MKIILKDKILFSIFDSTILQKMGLEIFGGEIVKDGDRVWDYDVDGTRIEGTMQILAARSKEGEPIWEVHWDLDPEDFNYLVLNPLQLHKISKDEQPKAK